MPRKVYRFRIVLSILVLSIIGFATAKFISYAKTQRTAAPSAAAITINSHTISDAGGGNGDGNADPNETLTESVTFTNTGDATANNVQLSTTLSSLLSATGGTGNVSIGPIAVPDTFANVLPNVKLVIPTAGTGLLVNDLNPSGVGALTITGFGDTLANANANAPGNTFTSVALGSLTVNADGSFNYDAPVANTAQKQFFYTLSNGTKTSVGTVTLTFQTTKVWFINNNAGACASQCDGRLSHPFTSISGYLNALITGNPPVAGDVIFFYESSAAYNGNMGLLANQKVIGQDATASFLTISGVTQPPGTDQLPVMNSANGTTVLITSGTNAFNLSPNNTIRGLTIGAAGTKIFGSSFGTLTLGNNASPDVTLTGAGQALDLTTGNFGSTSGLVSLASTSGTRGILLSGVGGAISFGSTTISGVTTQGILIGTTTADINFGNTSVTGGTDGVSFQNNANSGHVLTFGTLNVAGGSGNAFLHGAGGGNVTVTGAATLSSSKSAISVASPGATNTINFQSSASLTNFDGTVPTLSWVGTAGAVMNFGSLSIQTPASPSVGALSATTGGTINVTNATGTINAGTSLSPAVVANGVALNLKFATTNSSSASISTAISLTNVSGTSDFGTGSLNAGGGSVFNISGGSGTVTYGGTITQTAAFRAVNIDSKTAGTVNLNGAISCTTSCTGVSLTNNTGATVNIGGNMTLNTAANDSFTATGGGTLNVTGTTNAITNTTGRVINIANTTIGASGVTFQSVNHNAANSGANTAITLTATGAGAFTVTGTGTTAGTGGTIQNIQGADAVRLTTTGGLVTLKNMLIQDITASTDASANNDNHSNIDAIHGQTVNGGLTLNNVTIQRISDSGINGSVDGASPTATVWNGLTLTNCTFTNTNRFNVASHADAQSEGAVYMSGIKGTVSVTGTTFQNAGNGLFFDQTDTSGTLDMTVTGNSFLNLYKEIGTSSVGNYGIFLRQIGTLSSSVRIGDVNETNAALGNTFTNGGDRSAIDVIADTGSTGSMKSSISKNTFTVNDHSSPGVPAGSLNYNFPQSGVLLRSVGTGSGNYEAVFSGNTFNECMHADGGIGNLSIILEKGDGEVIVRNNIFNKPWDAPVELRGDGQSGAQTSAKVLFTANTYPDGVVGDGTTDLGGQSPYDAWFAQARNNGRLDLTMQNESPLGLTDTTSAHGNFSFWAQTTTSGDILNLFLQNIQAPRGYRLQQNTSTTFNLFRNGSVSGTAQGVLHDNGDRGGAGVDTTDPPAVSTVGTITLSAAAPALPSITTPFVPILEVSRPESFAPDLGFVPGTPAEPVHTAADGNVGRCAFVEDDSACKGMSPTAPAPRLEVTEPQSGVASLTDEADLGTEIATISYSPVVNVLGSGAVAEVQKISHSVTTEAQPSVIAELYEKLTSSVEPTVQAAPDATITSSPLFNLPAGASVTITYQVTVNPGPYAAGINKNIATAATITATGIPSANSSPAAFNLDASPSISVSNSDGSGFAEPGATIVYAVAATNANIINGQDATGVKLTQSVPANTTFNLGASDAGWAVSAGNPGGCANGAPAGTSCTNTIGALSANGTAVTKNFAVDVTGLLAGTVTTITDTGSVADDAANGPNQGTPISQGDTDQVRGTWIGGTSTDFGTAANWVNGILPVPGNNISVPTTANGGGANAPTEQNIDPDVTLGRVFLARDVTIQSPRTVTINSSLVLGANKILGTGILELANGASLTFTPNQGWIVAALKRNFVNGAAFVNGPTATYTYPVASGPALSDYFPVDVTPAAGSGGSLTIQALSGNPAGTDPTKTLGHNWAVAATGAMQADLRFSYVNNATGTPGMPPGTYVPIRVTSGTPTSFANNCPAGPCVDNTAKTIFMPGVTTFNGNWTAGVLAPTAATVTVSGRVFAAAGTPLRNARVILDDGSGHQMIAMTNSFGYYHFDEVQSGSTYLMNPSARGYNFTPRVVTVNDQLADLDIVALP